MKKLAPCFFVLLFICCTQIVQAQEAAAPARAYRLPKLDERSYVRDSAGKRYEYTAWSSMVASGRYAVKVATLPNEKPSLIIGRVSKAERDEALSKLPKPDESPFFKTGEALKSFNASDISGQLVDSKQLTGKIIVLSFWYVNNAMCRRQIPDLNTLAAAYTTDPDVVFISVPMDDKDALNEFLQSTPFKYRHLDKGKSINSRFNIKMHPTDVVIDKKGKVQFHTTGYSAATPYWIAKTIEQIKTS